MTDHFKQNPAYIQTMEKIKNYVILGLLVLLLISGGLNIYQNKIRKNDRVLAELNQARNETAIAGHKALAKSLASRADEVEAKRVHERDSMKVAVSALKIENQTYRKTISRLRPLVAARIDSVPDLRAFVAAQDSTIAGQDTLITSLEQAHTAEVTQFQEIQRLNKAEIGELVSITDGLQESLVSEQGNSRKWEKKAKKKLSFGIGAGYGVQSHGGNITTGPTIQAEIHYALFRF